MRWTLAELEAWRGHEALDAEAEPVGEVAATFVGDESGAPRWLAVRTGAHGDDVTPVPVQGAEPTGRAIRFPHLAGTIAAAPHLQLDDRISTEQERQLASFYGLETEPVPTPLPPAGGRAAVPAVVDALRAAHALEREALSRLRSLRSSIDDAELRHDVSRHLTETEGHAAAIAGRLEQLARAPSSLRDALGMATAKRAGAAEKLDGANVAELLREALAFERRECAAYDQLAATARAAGDGATAEVAARVRADEVAMAETIAGALRRMGQSG